MKGAEVRIENGEPKLLAVSCQLLAGERSSRGRVLNPEPRHGESRLRRTRTLNPFPARRAFTLTELLVSLVILVGMMTLIATIFSTAGRSSGQAEAQIRLQRHLRQASETISEDLARTLPGREAGGAPKGVLAIAGATVKAADRLKDGKSDHRVDILMLITQQRFEPFIYQPPTGAGSPTVFEGYKQVVYSHADIGKLDPTNGQWFPTVKYVETRDLLRPGESDMLASQFHLARRSIGFIRSAANGLNASAWPLTLPAFLGTRGGILVPDMPDPPMTDAAYDIPMSEILNRTTPGYYRYGRNLVAGQIKLMESFLTNSDGMFLLDRVRSPDPFLLLESNWWRLDSYNTGIVKYLRTEPSGDQTTQFSVSKWPPYYLSYDSNDTVTPGDPLTQPYFRFWPQWFCSEPDPAVNSAELVRTRLDPMPPPGMPERTSAYFLPACSEFKVEFTYDDPRELLTSDGQPVDGQPVLADTNGDGHIGPPYAAGFPPDGPAVSPIEWRTVPAGEIYVWTGLDVEPNVYRDINGDPDPRNLTFPYRWPRALRITIRAYAPGGALDYPIEQTLIHVW